MVAGFTVFVCGFDHCFSLLVATIEIFPFARPAFTFHPLVRFKALGCDVGFACRSILRFIPFRFHLVYDLLAICC